MGCSRFAAFFTASLALWDNMIAIYSRLILTDIYLWTFHAMAIGASFMSTNMTLSPRTRTLWVGLTGLFLGCALSCKYLAGGTLAMVGFHQLAHVLQTFSHDLQRKREKGNKKDDETDASSDTPLGVACVNFWSTALWKSLVILGLAATVFFTCWGIHAQILRYDGGGTGFMPREYQEILSPRHGCPNRANATIDCGWWDITKEQCEAKGCCWDPSSGANYCYPTYDQPESLEKFNAMSIPKKIDYNIRQTWRNNQGNYSHKWTQSHYVGVCVYIVCPTFCARLYGQLTQTNVSDAMKRFLVGIYDFQLVDDTANMEVREAGIIWKMMILSSTENLKWEKQIKFYTPRSFLLLFKFGCCCSAPSFP